MHSLTRFLLATTSFTMLALLPARAAVIFESDLSGGFGQTFATSAAIAGNDTAVGNLANYDAVGLGYVTSSYPGDFFRLSGPTGGGSLLFNLIFTASGAAAYFADFGAGPVVTGYYGLESAATSTEGGSEGGSLLLQTLSRYNTSLLSAGGSGSSSGGGAGTIPLTVSPFGNGGGASSSSSTPSGPAWPSSDLRPVLSFYDENFDPLTTITLVDGNSVDVAGVMSAGQTLYVSVSTGFDYTLAASTSETAPVETPEPASAALLGLGAAALAARRRKRIV